MLRDTQKTMHRNRKYKYTINNDGVYQNVCFKSLIKRQNAGANV